MIKLNITKFLLSSTGLVVLSGCSLASMPGGYSPIEKQTVQELSSANYTPRSEDQRAAILTQDLFAQATFWSREYDLNPADLEAAINLSSTLRRLGNPHQSIEVAQTTRALYPRDVDLMAELAASLIANNNPKDALPLIDTALRQRPNTARLWSLKGAAFDQFEQFAEARQYYSKGLSLAPNDPGIIANVGLSYALEGDPKTAEIWLRRAANMSGASASTRQNLSLVLGLQNKFDEAEKWARRDLDPQAVVNNISYIRALRGSSMPINNVQTLATRPTKNRPQPIVPTNKSFSQTASTNLQRRPQPAIQPQAPQAQQAYGSPYQRPSAMSAPATRLTNYGQVDMTKADGSKVLSARDAALAAARQASQARAPTYASSNFQQQAAAQIPQKMAPRKMAPLDVLGRISQKNIPKNEIAQRQLQQLAGRAQMQQQAQHQVQPYSNSPSNVPYGVTVTYPNSVFPQTAQAGVNTGQTPQNFQEQLVRQPARQRRR